MSGLSASARAQAAAVLEVDPAALRVQPVGGGCISPAARVTGGARSVFVKSAARGSPPGLFHAEAAALGLLASARTVRVPDVLLVSDDALVLEWLEPGRADTEAWRTLGGRLAALHRTSAADYGLDRDNYIGPLPQPNGWMSSWPQFFRALRIQPQLERAVQTGAFDARAQRDLHAFADELPAILGDTADEGASLLHGDLWRGNALPLASGEIALVDPASYYGHREVDLAMAELFGGFPPAFFECYESAWPTEPRGRARRRAAYRVYYLLVHVNLFGCAYAVQTLDSARAARG